MSDKILLYTQLSCRKKGEEKRGGERRGESSSRLAVNK